jgi:hypothetical protein
MSAKRETDQPLATPFWPGHTAILVGSSQIRILYFVSAGGVELHTGRFANVMPDFRVDGVARLEATPVTPPKKI